MKKAGTTATLPEAEAPVALAGADLVTALRIVGSGIEHSMLARQATFSLGSSASCDIAVDSPYVSALQLVLDRRDTRVRVHDQTTKNGTVFKGRHERSFDIGAGDTFVTATTTFLAMSEDMRAARTVFSEVLGLDDHRLVDKVLLDAVGDRPLLITAEAGAEAERLAEAIHAASLRRSGPFVPLSGHPTSRAEGKSALDRARRGTLVMQVDGTEGDGAFVSMLLSADYRVRGIIIASTLKQAAVSLGLDALARLDPIEIRPLRERAGDIPQLLERACLAERASLRFADTTETNQATLRRYGWPGNLGELRQAARRLVGLAEHGSVRKAAPKLGIPRTTLQYWVDMMELEVPVTRAREDARAPARRM